MYKYNIYFLTKMGDLQNIHTALSLFYKFHMHLRDKTYKMPNLCSGSSKKKKNLTGEITLKVLRNTRSL